MTRQERNIHITVFYEGEPYHISTYPNEYRNLMMLIFDRVSPDEFGDCLGMGKCGTCQIEVIESPHNLTFYERNEEITRSKIGITDSNIRLSCQVQVDEHTDGLILKLHTT